MKKTLLLVVLAVFALAFTTSTGYAQTPEFEVTGLNGSNVVYYVGTGDIVYLELRARSEAYGYGNQIVQFDPTKLKCWTIEEDPNGWFGQWNWWTTATADENYSGGGTLYYYEDNDKGSDWAQYWIDNYNNAGPSGSIDNDEGIIRMYYSGYVGYYDGTSWIESSPIRLGFEVISASPIDFTALTSMVTTYNWDLSTMETSYTSTLEFVEYAQCNTATEYNATVTVCGPSTVEENEEFFISVHSNLIEPNGIFARDFYIVDQDGNTVFSNADGFEWGNEYNHVYGPFSYSTTGTLYVGAGMADRSFAHGFDPLTYAYLDVNIGVVDETPPVITINSPEEREYEKSEELIISFTAIDNESGISSIEAYLDGTPAYNGQEINLLNYSTGPHTLTVTATNGAELFSTKTTVFYLVASLESLFSILDGYYDAGYFGNHGTLNSIKKKIENAHNSFDAGNDETGGNVLWAATNALLAQEDKKITIPDLENLIADVISLDVAVFQAREAAAEEEIRGFIEEYRITGDEATRLLIIEAYRKLVEDKIEFTGTLKAAITLLEKRGYSSEAITVDIFLDKITDHLIDLYQQIMDFYYPGISEGDPSFTETIFDAGTIDVFGGEVEGESVYIFAQENYFLDFYGVPTLIVFAPSDAACCDWGFIQFYKTLIYVNGNLVDTQGWFLDGPTQPPKKPGDSEANPTQSGSQDSNHVVPGTWPEKPAEVLVDMPGIELDFDTSRTPIGTVWEVHKIFQSWLVCQKCDGSVEVYGYLSWSFIVRYTKQADGTVTGEVVGDGATHEWVDKDSPEGTTNYHDPYKEALEEDEYPEKWYPE